MSKTKFTAWVAKEIKIEDLDSVGKIYHQTQSNKGDVMSWPRNGWPPYQIEITISTFISDGITEGAK